MKILRKLFRRRVIRIWIARALDMVTPICPGRVTFVTRANVPFAGNVRIVADMLAEHGTHQIAVYKDGPVPERTKEALRAKGVRVLSGFSITALRFVLSSETVVLSHSARDALLTRHRRGRRVINLWHGVALKRIELLMRPTEQDKDKARKKLIRQNARIYDAMVASSPADRLVNALAFGMPFDKVHPIGLPRFDYLRPGHPLPADLEAEALALDVLVAGRSLVLYAPTFRDAGLSAFEFMDEECVRALRALCKKIHIVFGIRPHPYERRSLKHICDDTHIIDLSVSRFSEAAVIMRRADTLIVDYSSIWVDYLMRRKPILGFVPDLKHYWQEDRGFIYDHETVFPGPVFESWPVLTEEIKRQASTGFTTFDDSRHKIARALFLPSDDMNSSCTDACINLFFNEHRSVATHSQNQLTIGTRAKGTI